MSWSGYSIQRPGDEHHPLYNSERQSFIDLLADRMDIDTICEGVNQCSEDRIFIKIKKHQDLDFAVVAHSLPHYLHLPHCNRDMSIRQIRGNDIHALWLDNEEFEREFSYGNIIEKFGNKGEFVRCMNLWKRYLYDYNAQENRYFGNMMLIDLCLELRKIPSVHLIWLKSPHIDIKSGAIDDCLKSLIEENYQSGYTNNISLDGNLKIADYLEKLLKSQWSQKSQ